MKAKAKKAIVTIVTMLVMVSVFGEAYKRQYKVPSNINVANVYTICEDFGKYDDHFDEKVAKVRWNFAMDYNLTFLHSKTVEDSWAKGKFQIVVYPFDNHLIDFVIVKDGEITTCRYFGNMVEDYTAGEYVKMMESEQYAMLADFYNHQNLKDMLAVFERPALNR